ncbi:M48 family metalloprotease [Acetobacter fallax]|nr:M48 family metalloprotease [Acetobacter fallax]
MKKSIVSISVVSTLLTLSGCSGGIPEKGRFIDHVQFPATYPATTNLQNLFSPANTHPTGVVIDPQLTAYPQQIVDALLAQWPGPRPNAQVYLVPVEDFTSDVSAHGAIFLNAGLISYFHDHPEVQSEDTMAFILGHELSHILLGHTVANRQNKEIKNVASNAMKWGSLIGGKFAGATVSGAQAALSSMGTKILVDTALFPSWTRGQEEEADTLAVDLMSKAGYSVDTALSVFKAMEAEDARDTARRTASVANGQTSFHVDNFTMTSKRGDALDASVINELNTVTQEHPHAADREAASSRYINREYSDRDVVMLKNKPFLAWVNSKPVMTFLKQSRLLQTATEEIAVQNWGEAHKTLARVGAPLNSSQDWIYLTAVTDTHLGQQKQSGQLLDEAAHRDDVTLPIARMWGEKLSKAGKTDEAETYMATEQEAFDDRSLLTDRITNAKRAKNGLLLDKLILQCAASGDDGLQAACSSANK